MAGGIGGGDRAGRDVDDRAGRMPRGEHLCEPGPVDGGGEAADDRDAEGTADFPDGVVDGAAGAGLVGGHGGHDGGAGWCHHQSHAGADDRDGQGDRRVGGVHARGGQVEQAEAHQRHAGRDDHAGAEALGQDRRQRRHGADGQGERQRAHPGGQRGRREITKRSSIIDYSSAPPLPSSSSHDNVSVSHSAFLSLFSSLVDRFH